LQARDHPGKIGGRSLDNATLTEKKILEIERTMEHLIKRFDRIDIESKEIAKAVGLYKQKFQEVEKFFQSQNESVQELGRIKKSIKEIKEESNEVTFYRVKAGDSIEKIARQFGTTPEQIKKINQLHNDLILVGQEIRVPK
jgi:hypothetical protein